MPALQQRYPALAWVPADASYAATGKVADIAASLREIVIPAGLLPGVSAAEIQRQLQQVFGLDPLDPGQLAAAGIAIDATAALYSSGLWPTLVVPIEDPAALRRYVDSRWPSSAVKMRERDGVELYTWQPTPHFAFSYAIVGDWLLVHAGDPAREGASEAWLDAARATYTGVGIAGADDWVRAAGALRDRVAGERDRALGVLGLVRVPRIVEALGGGDACLAAIGGAVERVAVGADLSPRSGEGVISIELTPVAAAAARLGVAVPPSDGYQSYRATAGLYADLGVDLRWLEGALTGAGCPSLAEPLREATRALDAFDMRTVHVAVRQLLLEERRVQAAAHAALRSRRQLTQQVLDAIPGRSLLERTVTIGTARVRVIDLGVFPRIGYVLADDRAVVAVGAESIDEVFGAAHSGAAPEGALLAAVGVRPERMPDLDAALAVLLEQLGYPASAASTLVGQVLSRYADTGLSLALVGRSIELRGWYRLAP